MEDGGHVGFGEGLEVTEGVAVEVERLDEKRDVLLLGPELGEGEGQAKRLEPAAEGVDAGARGLAVGQVPADAEDIAREAGEPPDARLVDVVHPCGHDYG